MEKIIMRSILKVNFVTEKVLYAQADRSRRGDERVHAEIQIL